MKRSILLYSLFFVCLGLVFLGLYAWFSPEAAPDQPAPDSAVADSSPAKTTAGSEMTTDERVQEMQRANELSAVATDQATYTFTPQVHAGAGTATIQQQGDKRFIVLSDNFYSDPGPDLHVFITAASNPKTSEELHTGGAIDLGALKSTHGAQVYDIPSTVDFDIASVVVYCLPFKVIFTSAN